MEPRNVVSKKEWFEARRAFMAKEKEFQKARDALAAERRALPWMKVEQDYVFDTNDGPKGLSELFENRSQLIVWHFMFGVDWEEGCPSCSFWADLYSPAVIHLNHRDVSLVAISSAPLAKLNAYKKRMGWLHEWVSSGNNSFNQDFAVAFTQEEIDGGENLYNHHTSPAFVTEMPGMSVFAKGDDGAVYRTYSTFARGLDTINGAYQQLDMVPKGRDEDSLPFPMGWVRRRDQYED